MERFGATFLIAGVVTFLLGFFLQGAMPIITLRNMKVASVEEVAGKVIPEFTQLAEDYPEEFRRYFGEVSSASQIRALELGKSVYIIVIRSSSGRSRRRICASGACRRLMSTRT
jgi:hypothetical protein